MFQKCSSNLLIPVRSHQEEKWWPVILPSQLTYFGLLSKYSFQKSIHLTDITDSSKVLPPTSRCWNAISGLTSLHFCIVWQNSAIYFSFQAVNSYLDSRHCLRNFCIRRAPVYSKCCKVLMPRKRDRFKRFCKFFSKQTSLISQDYLSIA